MVRYIAHAGEELESESSSIAHKISDNPLIAILLASAVILVIASIIIMFLSKNKPSVEKEGQEDAKS